LYSLIVLFTLFIFYKCSLLSLYTFINVSLSEKRSYQWRFSCRKRFYNLHCFRYT